MYDYRNWTPAQRKQAVAERRSRCFPAHQPPHVKHADQFRIVTGTCFEHQSVLDSPERLSWFEDRLLTTLADHKFQISAWVVLPNHYHLLIFIPEINDFAVVIGRLHGSTSYQMNQADDTTGRKVWYRYTDRVMRSDRHRRTTLNYIHHNPVRHGYVKRQDEWPWSSFHWYLRNQGRAWLLDLWRDYPIRDYGNKWDHS